MARRKKSTRKQSGMASFVIIIAVLVVCAVSVFKISDLYSQSRQLAVTERALEKKIEEAQLERQQMEAQEQYMHTKQYVEDVAKEKLGLVYPDEIVIRPSQ